MDSSKKYSNPNPLSGANPISKLFFCWTFPTFKYGYKKDLEIKDLYSTTKTDLSEPLADVLERNWNAEILNAKQANRKPSLLKAITKTFIKIYSLYGVMLFINCCVLKMAMPLVLAKYIQHFDRTTASTVGEGWGLAVGVILLAFSDVLINHHAFIGQNKIGMRCRIACCSLIYRKLLRLNPGSASAGQVVNLLSNDVARFDIVPMFLHYVWIMPIQAIIAAYLMYESIGYSAFAGLLAITIQAVPIQGQLSRWQGQLRYKIALRTDHRVQLMSEITSGIQVIKMYAWERPFEKVVEVARKLEIDLVTTTSYIRGFSMALMVFTERFTLYLTVITYSLTGHRLTGAVVFSAAQFFNTIQLYMAIFYPLAITSYAEAKVSVKRLEEFLLQEEGKQIFEADIPTQETEKYGSIKLVNAKATWIANPIIDTLSNINLEIKPGTLVAVVGQVGSGKSSLLQVLLKELPLHSGELEITGKISYSSQEPWLFVASVRNNILFGQPYDKHLYRKVVKVCALQPDFDQFPHGDQTLVGERGVSLSGGQRARINLARSVYRAADIYLFDDPLSAVDTHVGKHLFHECIVKYLHNKTRILVTHQLQFLEAAHLIVIINNGQIQKMGTYNELKNQDLAYLNEPSQEEAQEKATEQKTRERLMSVISQISTSIDEDELMEPQETQELMEKGAISASLYVEYFKAGASLALFIFFIIVLLTAQTVTNGADIWVTYWTNNEEFTDNQITPSSSVIANGLPVANGYGKSLNNTEENLFTTAIPDITKNLIESGSQVFNALSQVINETEIKLNKTVPELLPPTQPPRQIDDSSLAQSTYIYIYTGFIVGSIILTTLRSIIFYKICMTASKTLHNTMFSNILQATMRFFDTNPSGRILNRFSKDIGAVDELLPKVILDTIQVFMVMMGILIMAFLVTPWMIIPAVLLAGLFYCLRVVYLASAQDVKRLEGITRAPVFSHVAASVNGLTTIRASKAQMMVRKEFDILQDQHTGSWFLFISLSEAFGFYLDLISLVFLIIVIFQFLILDDGNTLTGNVGLVVQQCLILTGMVQYGIRQASEVASQMTSVERVLQYTKLDKEGPFESIGSKKPHRDWPQNGKIVFENVILRYVPEDPPVLCNLNFKIDAGEKVGIVGRTGAGKSSLISALFRLAPIDGIIYIDGIDTKQIGLLDLRSKISIIPQEPVLFSASIRQNLDPFKKSNDETLWKALEDVELKDSVESLDAEVSEGGSNFSAGQRQLICLARAILRNNKVLVMDEATANVDPQTDALIQSTIRKNFRDCTVLTIAHRLNTVMDSDKVLVMDAGEAVEFGHPHELLQKDDAYFTSMVKQTGKGMEEKLRKIAEEAFKNTSHEETEAKSSQEETAPDADEQNE